MADMSEQDRSKIRTVGRRQHATVVEIHQRRNMSCYTSICTSQQQIHERL